MSDHHRKMKRIEVPEHSRYLTCSCYQRLALFNNDKIKDAFASHISRIKEDLGFRLYAWVIMPEHFHLLLQPKDASATGSLIVRKMKAGFAQKTIRRWRELRAPILGRITTTQGETRFWQAGGGYDRNVYSAEENENKIDYTHLNPMRRGLVERAEDWKWSSVRWYLGRDDYAGPEIDPIRW